MPKPPDPQRSPDRTIRVGTDPDAQPPGALAGTVARLVADKGFFFIKEEVSGQDYFAHRSALRNCQMDELHTGDQVRFDEEHSPKGPRAGEIYLVRR